MSWASGWASGWLWAAALTGSTLAVGGAGGCSEDPGPAAPAVAPADSQPQAEAPQAAAPGSASADASAKAEGVEAQGKRQAEPQPNPRDAQWRQAFDHRDRKPEGDPAKGAAAAGDALPNPAELVPSPPTEAPPPLREAVPERGPGSQGAKRPPPDAPRPRDDG